ncbi:hypothetical protein T440DRAFT_464894 [Plenodomus tracheiphilus IPT5]|uniref:Probable double zinc ribbon domain-containing protein n=1 Tax=Plenodomus tracheiphilus IPT5 TaxID=1408161 RepID=A0A6A7BJ00_9PLEO|nr:hypothetical protein T440DRAFT_464894 [Plenodomus tracheiphilus IPT5]
MITRCTLIITSTAASPPQPCSSPHHIMRDLDRKSNVLHAKRLSLAVTSRLSSFFEKADTTDTSPPSKSRTTPHRLTKPQRTGSGLPILQEDFDSRILAELPTEPDLIEDNDYPNLRALRTDEDIGDGLWLCSHCRHENILRHYKGAFPFKHVRCNRCNHIICSYCHTSAILSPIPYGMIHARTPHVGCEVRYCHICPTCGLSHRAEQEGATLDFYGAKCADCGITSWGDWPRYHIGNHEPYRRDPDATFAALVDQRAADASRLAFQWVIANVESRPASLLGYTGSDFTVRGADNESIQSGGMEPLAWSPCG